MATDKRMNGCGHPLPPPGSATITVDLVADVVAVTQSPFGRRNDEEFFCTHYSVAGAVALAQEILKNVASARRGGGLTDAS